MRHLDHGRINELFNQIFYRDEHAVALPDGAAAAEEGDDEDDASYDDGADGRQLDDGRLL